MKYNYTLIILGILLTGCAQEKLNLDEKEERSKEMQQARAYAAEKNWQAAEQAYSMILKENGSFARPHLDLALLYQQRLTNYLYAIYHYEQYMKKRPQTGKRLFIEDQCRSLEKSLASALVKKYDLKTDIQPTTPTSSKVTDTTNKEKTSRETQSVYRIYHVRSGDTLSKIAKEFCGDSNRWNEIYQLNRKTLQSPASVRVGQTLILPAQ